MEKQLTKLLTEVKVIHNSIVKVEDFSQDFEVEISIVHK